MWVASPRHAAPPPHIVTSNALTVEFAKDPVGFWALMGPKLAWFGELARDSFGMCI